MAVFIGAVKSVKAKDLINMGIHTQTKGDNSISISYEMGQYDVRGFVNREWIWESYERFSDAIKRYKYWGKKL